MRIFLPLALCGSLFLAGCGRPAGPKAILNFPTVAGMKMASVIDPKLTEYERILMIANWEDMEPPYAAAFQKGLEEGLKDRKLPSQITLINIAISPDAESNSFVPADDVDRVLKGRDNCGAVIFFGIMPYRGSEDWPSVYLVTPLEGLDETDPLPGYVQAAICYKSSVDWSLKAKRFMSNDEVFDMRYLLRLRE